MRALYWGTLGLNENFPVCGPVLGDFENFRKVPYRGGHCLEDFAFHEKIPTVVCVLERLVFYEKIPIVVCVLERLVFTKKSL